MAYKKMKSNKRHIAELRKDYNDYYNKKRREKRAKKKALEQKELSFEELEAMGNLFK